MKECIKCNTEKDISEFSQNKNNKDGLMGKCIECVKFYKKKYRDENREIINSKKKLWNLENKKYKSENKEEISIHFPVTSIILYYFSPFTCHFYFLSPYLFEPQFNFSSYTQR